MAYSRGAVERAMKKQEVILRAIAGKLIWVQAADPESHSSALPCGGPLGAQGAARLARGGERGQLHVLEVREPPDIASVPPLLWRVWAFARAGFVTSRTVTRQRRCPSTRRSAP